MPRDENKLPKTCPECRSKFWQKPLTDYWRKVREDNKAKRDAVVLSSHIMM